MKRKRLTKRIAALAMTLAMILTAIPLGAASFKASAETYDIFGGEVTITNCGKSASGEIMLTEGAVVENPTINSVSIDDVSLYYKSSAKINTNISADEDAEYTVSYSSSDNSIVTVDNNGNVYGAKRGSATITCSVTEPNGNTVKDTCTVTVKYSFWQWIIKIVLFGWIWY